MPSSVIKFFKYNEDSKELNVTFQSGHRYVYSAVPLEIFQAMKAAFSKGEFFHKEIRDHFRYRREE
jgi:hypothetical protein